MTTYHPPKKNTAFVMEIALVSQANTKIMQSSATIAAGDFKVSIDGGALNNLATLPVVTPAGSKLIKIDLSAAEMNGDNIAVVCSDAAGAEWCDLVLNLQTTARQIDDLTYPIVSGRGTVVDANGLVDANVVKVGPTGSGTAQTARDVGASVLLSSGTGTGQLDFTSGVVKASLVQILGTALTETSGQIAAAFKKFFDKATPTGTINSLPDAVAGAAGGVFIAGTNAATTVTTALTTTFTGNLTGNVGGNVTGSAGSVVGAVGSVTGAVGSVTAGVTVTTNNDKTGYSLTSGPLDAAGIRTAVGLASANLDTQLTTIDDFLDTEMAAALAAVDTEIAAIKLQTDLIPASPAAVGSAMTLAANAVTAAALATDAVNEIADGVLDRNMATGTDSGSPTVRTVRQALRFLRNKWSISGTTLTVTKEDDVTASYTATLTTDAAANPVTASDPA